MLGTQGAVGNGTFIDGTGATTMDGNSGNDLYSYASGDGALTISDGGGTDTLKLGTGLTTSNVVMTENSTGTDLWITDGVSGDKVTIQSQISSAGFQLEKLIYGDGTTASLNSGLSLTATTGSTTLIGTSGNDTMIAVTGTGTETLQGNDGNDTYSYGSGMGKVVIADTGGTDTLKLGTGLTSANVVLTEAANGKDLLVTDGVTGDQITVLNQYFNPLYALETLVYGNGSTLSLENAVLTATPGTSTLTGTSGNDVLQGTAGNQTLIGNGGSDQYLGGSGTEIMKALTGTIGNNVFTDGTGTTTMDGNTGNDLYSYVSGDGTLTISDAGGTDTLKLGSGLTTANLVLTENSTGTDLLITDGVSGDKIDILSQISSAGFQLESVIYGDGTTATLNSALSLTATTGSTTLKGTSGNDTLVAVAGTGTELLEGAGGNDTYSYASRRWQCGHKRDEQRWNRYSEAWKHSRLLRGADGIRQRQRSADYRWSGRRSSDDHGSIFHGDLRGGNPGLW